MVKKEKEVKKEVKEEVKNPLKNEQGHDLVGVKVNELGKGEIEGFPPIIK